MFFTILVYSTAVLVLMSLSMGYLWTLAYRFKAWRRGTGVPRLKFDAPFGIPMTRKFVRELGNHNLLHFLNELSRDAPTKTMLDQRFFHWAFNTMDPENIKTILSTKFKDYSLGLRESQVGFAFGSGIFTLSGEGWKHSRQMLRPQFTRDQISQLDSVTDHVSTLIKVIDFQQKRDGYVEAQNLFHELTIDTATEFLFGESLNCLGGIVGGQSASVTHNGITVTANEFVESYMFMLESTVSRLILGPFYPLGDGLKFRKHIKRAHVMVDYYVDLALKRAATEKSQESGYVFSWELAKVTKDPIVIRDQILNILIAGRDTTAQTMTLITYYLSQRPDVLKKLRKIILEEFGTLEENRTITFEMLRGCKYLTAVINEVLRLAPVVPLNFRTAIRDTVLPTGGGPNGDQPILVPKGFPVSYSVFVTHRLPEIWGADADEFNPDRWMEKQDIPAWAYLPFNGGPRICLGQQFALTELALTWVRLLQTYSNIVPGPNLPKDPKYDFLMTIKYSGDLDVRFEK